MSKLGRLGNFFKGMAKFALPILMMTPLAPIAMIIASAMQEAEALHVGHGTGPDKLAHVLAIAMDAALAVNTAAGHVVIDPVVLQQMVGQVVGAIVGVVNVVQHPVGLPEPVPVPEPPQPLPFLSIVNGNPDF